MINPEKLKTTKAEKKRKIKLSGRLKAFQYIN